MLPAADGAGPAYPVPHCEWNADWLTALRQSACQPPRAPRQPLYLGSDKIGSVEPLFFHAFLEQNPQLVGPCLAPGVDNGWCIQGNANTTLAVLADALRIFPGSPVGRLWRDEKLAVRADDGRVLAAVERGAVRALGIATRAVHLLGLTPTGDSWIQQRALDKPTDPGLWDTLMGGMVPVSDTLEQALARETWEEAGLLLSDLSHLHHAGSMVLQKPAHAGDAIGYVVERADCYIAQVPANRVPQNQDGEVAQFVCASPQVLHHMLEQGQFTLEAALLLAHFQPASRG